MSNLYFEKYTPQMRDECSKIFAKVFTREPWNDVYKTDHTVQDYFSAMEDNNKFIGFVACTEDRIVGLCLGLLKPWINGIEYYIDELCIDIDYQGQGIGTKFMEFIKKPLQEIGANGIILNTECRYPAYEFYLKNEFIQLEDIVIMVKEL